MSRASVVTMIPLGLSMALLCVLNIWTIENAAGCGDRQVKVEGRCCDFCPPGKYVKEICSEHQQTVCGTCEEGYYSNHYSIFDKCEECRSCQQKYTEKCSPTTNANCSCNPGFLCSNNICSSCEENQCVTGEKLRRTEKPAGEGLIKYSYHCEPLCHDKEYFDVEEEVCKPKIQCSLFGFAVLFPGNKTHNSICDLGVERERNGGDLVHVILGIGFVLLSFTLLVLLSFFCIKTLIKYKPYANPANIEAVSTNTTDYNLSKEESGRQLIIQDESKNNSSLDELDLEKLSAF